MARRYPPLSQRQLDVLAWIVDGCPDGQWSDFTYKTTTYALADRGLVTVDRRRGKWSARLTGAGRDYLDHRTHSPAKSTAAGPGPAGESQSQPSSEQRRNSSSSGRSAGRGSRLEFSAEQLISEVQSQGGVLTVRDPTAMVRSAYRRAVSRAILDGLVPTGHVLRHAGRDRGDLVIRLFPRDDAPPAGGPLAPVPVPTSLDEVHEAVQQVRDHPQLLDVGEDSRRRALLVLQAVADECDRRGYDFGLRGESRPTFHITINDVSLAFTLSEEYEQREAPNLNELQAARYEWQRVRSTVERVRSGRLVIRLEGRYPATFWADRKRWTLVDKLPAMFEQLEQRSAGIVETRARIERDRQERRTAWETALDQARDAYIAELNRRRMDKQLVDASRAADLRRYANQIDEQHGTLAEPERAASVMEWAVRVRAEADRVDPLQHPGELAYVEPSEIDPAKLDPFMPTGMTARQPPV